MPTRVTATRSRLTTVRTRAAACRVLGLGFDMACSGSVVVTKWLLVVGLTGELDGVPLVAGVGGLALLGVGGVLGELDREGEVVDGARLDHAELVLGTVGEAAERPVVDGGAGRVVGDRERQVGVGEPVGRCQLGEAEG